MKQLRRSIKTRSKNTLFNPYTNGLSSYDMAYLSSKRVYKNKTILFRNNFKEEYAA